ncbi:tetratricopeptide repeat protein [Thermopolyspora sp. NPDC052614]|uniref:tetratricopeptide repeat protein n=1 Tax=Thermopolyspora sp. NPDC052614 TaxID=3155682 RepID=UPI003440DF1A
MPGASVRNEMSGGVGGTAIQAGSIHGGVQISVGGRVSAPAPAQLPPVPAVFVGREAELRELDERLGRAMEASQTPALIVISGLGGVGKSSLALRWLHGVRDRFADGQLYADLRGFTPGGAASVEEVLERFLRALGIAPDHVPAALDEQVTLFRSATAGRRLIIMLDNAISAAQVRSFLPSSGGSLVLVTTRHRLPGLIVNGAHFVELRPLRHEAGVELLGRVLGRDRIRAEAEAASTLVNLCGSLPIAVCASAARLALRPRWSVGRLVRELDDAKRRLPVLSSDADISTQAVFDVSYAALSADEAFLYRLLGLHPGPTFGAGVAAAAAELDEGRAAELLDELAGASLVQEEGEERYRFHDLLRLHAYAKAMEIDAPEEHRAAEVRMAKWFLRAAAAADLVVIPGRWHLGPVYEAVRAEPPAFDDPAAALDWLEEELPNLCAVLQLAYDRGRYDITWELCESLWGLFYFRKHYQQWLSTHELAVTAAQESGNPLAESRMSMALAYAYRDLNRYSDAADLYRRAVELERANDHPVGEAAALSGLGSTCLALGRAEEAIGHFEQARAIHERLGRPRGVTRMLRRLGEAYRDAGRFDEAVDTLTRTYELFAGLGETFEQARTLTDLGLTWLRAGRPGSAIGPLRRAHLLAERLGARHEQAKTSMYLADALVATGDVAGARDHLTRALEIFVDLVAPQAEVVRAKLAELTS